MKLRTFLAAVCMASLLGSGCSDKTQASTDPSPREETVRVAIGTQDTTINCAAGGPLVRELHLLEKYLPKTGRYAHVKYELQWENQPTGAQLLLAEREHGPAPTVPA